MVGARSGVREAMHGRGSGRRIGALVVLVTVAVGLGAAVGGAATGVPGRETDDIATEAPSGSGVASIEVSPSGNILKGLGESAGLTLAGSDRAYFEFAVESIAVVGSCPGRGVQPVPRNGHFVVLDIRATMSGDVRDVVTGGSDTFMPLTADAFVLVGPDGPVSVETQTDASWACFGAEALADPFVGPGEATEGLVVLDSPITSGTLVYAPSGVGWEWVFGE